MIPAADSKVKKDHHSIYRKDIDGLRALAILPVILFHAFPNLLPGGFVGVDIFFVISGFLISSIILREFESNRFSFLRFYGRRIRRLFPALSLVLASSLFFGWLALDADEFKMLGKHAVAGVAFVQNFVLWGEVGYFDINSELKPLLHLWSLAIEEQFYLLFPLLVWIAWRLGFRLLYVVSAITIASLLSNLLLVKGDPTGTFYFPHTRIWEILAGVLLAITLSSRSTAPPTGSAKASICSLIGLVLIIGSTLAFDKDHHFPGWRALLPVTGAVLIIYAGNQAWVNRFLLSNKALVFIGLISYPLYLWHWPLLSFFRIIESEPLSDGLKIILVTVSFVLAALTYLLIEKPIRTRQLQRLWIALLVVFMAIIGVTGYLIYERDLTSKLGKRVEAAKEWEQRHPTFEENCAEFFPKWNDRKDSFKCAFLERGKPELAVIGDSHARRIYIGISHFIYGTYNAGFFANACSMPFYDTSVAIHRAFRTPDYQYPKAKQINQALDFAINDPAVKLLILTTSACWSDIVDLKNLKDRNPNRIVERNMRLTLEKIKKSGKQAIYVLDNPLLDFDPKSCTSRPFRINSEASSCKFKREVYEKQRVAYFRIARSVLSDYPNVRVFDIADKLCDDEFCYAVINNELMYHDRSHLGFDGSIYVGQFLLPLIDEALREPK